MLVEFFLTVRAAGVPATPRELLDLLRALECQLAFANLEAFHALARTTLVKDERHFDRFDRAFAAYLEGVRAATSPEGKVPAEWLTKQLERHFTEEERRQLREALKLSGGFEELMDKLRERLAEQQGRHQGGSKWIGTGGTSPFGAYGYNPEGVRIGQDGSRHRSAIKVWDRREFRDFDGERELGTRGVKLALRRLRRFAREGAADELDLDGTIQGTAENAGLLDVRMRPERRNAVKVLLLLDVGGSMDDHVEAAEGLFSAARSEFKHLEHFYFHNCVYERLWRSNRRRFERGVATDDLLRTYGPDWKLVIVGDATMSPFEVSHPGGANERWNAEAGEVWLRRLCERWPKHAWLNPQPAERWPWHASIGMIQETFEGRMYPLTLEGIDRAARALS